MPRGPVKQILHTAEFRQVSSRGRTPICHGDRRGHSIDRGDTYFAIKDGLNYKGYCLSCARRILENGQLKLEGLFETLEEAEK